MTRALVVVAAALIAGCGGGPKAPSTSAPPPPPPPGTTTTTTRQSHIVRELDTERTGQCAITDERARGSEHGSLGLCIHREREEGGIPFITCTVFRTARARDGKEIEFHGFPGYQKLPNISDWRTPGCDAAAKKAAGWLVAHLRAS